VRERERDHEQGAEREGEADSPAEQLRPEPKADAQLTEPHRSRHSDVFFKRLIYSF